MASAAQMFFAHPVVLWGQCGVHCCRTGDWLKHADQPFGKARARQGGKPVGPTLEHLNAASSGIIRYNVPLNLG